MSAHKHFWSDWKIVYSGYEPRSQEWRRCEDDGCGEIEYRPYSLKRVDDLLTPAEQASLRSDLTHMAKQRRQTEDSVASWCWGQ